MACEVPRQVPHAQRCQHLLSGICNCPLGEYAEHAGGIGTCAEECETCQRISHCVPEHGQGEDPSWGHLAHFDRAVSLDSAEREVCGGVQRDQLFR